MSLLGKIAAFFGGGSASKACVVDGDRFAGGDRVGPGERFQALNKLARHASREGLNMKVVFGGRPLREAADGEVFNDVTVYYGESAEDVRKLLMKYARGGTMLITSDQALENDVSARGGSTMRISTLRKAMENAQSEGGGREGGGDRFSGRGDRDGGRRGGRGRRRGGRGDRGDRGERGERGPESSGQNASSQSSSNQPRPQEGGGGSGGGADSSVKSLIDLVE